MLQYLNWLSNSLKSMLIFTFKNNNKEKHITEMIEMKAIKKEEEENILVFSCIIKPSFI